MTNRYRIKTIRKRYQSESLGSGSRPWNPGKYDVIDTQTGQGLDPDAYCESVGEARAMARMLNDAAARNTKVTS